MALLRRYFDIPWETISVLFNHIYRTHLTQHGFHEYNFPMSRIKTQYYDSIEARQIVYIDNSFDEINNKWDSFRQFIEAVATDLGITIRRREADDCVHEGSYGSKERRKLRLESNTRKAKRKAGVSEGAWQNLDYQHAPQESIQSTSPSLSPLYPFYSVTV